LEQADLVGKTQAMSRAEHLETPAAQLDRRDFCRSTPGQSAPVTIGGRLRAFYGDLVRAPVPQRFARLLDRLARRAGDD
jgi:hypothetical protein